MGGCLMSRPIRSKVLRTLRTPFFSAASAEMQGFRLEMEDSLIMQASLDSQLHFPGNKGIALFGVFDGHGGSKASERCSVALVQALSECKDPWNSELVEEAFSSVDNAFLKDEKVRNHGSTACIAMIIPISPSPPFAPAAPARIRASYFSSLRKKLRTVSSSLPHENQEGGGEKEIQSKTKYRIKIANLGDSTAVVIDPGGNIVFYTTDHKPNNAKEFERIEKAGGRVQNNRVDGNLSLSRAFGDWPYKKNESLPDDHQMVIATPECTDLEVEEGSKLILCCDGLTERMTTDQLVEKTMKLVDQKTREKKELELDGTDLEFVALKMVDLALSSGSEDNLSFIIVDLTPSKHNSTTGETRRFELAKPLVSVASRDDSADQTFWKKYEENALRFGGSFAASMAKKHRENAMQFETM